MWFIITTMYAWILLAFSILPLWASEYPGAMERQKILDLIETIEQEDIPLQFSGYEDATTQEKEFLQFYKNNIYPVQMRSRKLSGVAGLLEIALDRALYENETEKQEWMKTMTDLNMEIDEFFSSAQLKGDIRKWARLSRGLKGKLARDARKTIHEDRQTGFGIKENSLLNRLAELETTIKQRVNESSVTGEHLLEYQKSSLELWEQFTEEEITLEDVKEGLQKLWPKGHHAKGHDVLQRVAPLLDEVAIIRTQLAKSKGFENWAQYELASWESNYRRGLRTVEDHMGFIEQILSETFESAKNFRQAILADWGYTSRDVEGVGIQFLMSEGRNFQGHHIAEDIEDVWLETMRESGFADSELMRINWDRFPRKNKNTQDYMVKVLDTIPKIVTLDTKTLDFKLPPQAPENFHPAAVFIIQNVISDGHGEYEAAFHEGGHALDYNYRRGVLEEESSDAYNEANAKTMERFFDDMQFLLAKGRDHNGNPPTQEMVEFFITDKELYKHYMRREEYFDALLDLRLWNEPYTEEGPGFTERFLAIHEDLKNRYLPKENIWMPQGVDAGSYKLISDIFYSGDVSVHAYVYADEAADMIVEHLLDVLEETTGRRTLYSQPSLADLLIKGLYERGSARPFPLAIEEFTGKKFEPLKVIERINQALDSFVRETNQHLSCEGLLESTFL